MRAVSARAAPDSLYYEIVEDCFRRIGSVAVALSLVMSSSCGLVSGLDSYSDGVCSGCDGSADVVANVEAAVEASPEAAPQGDDADDEASALDASAEGSSDGSGDAPPTGSDDAAPDATDDAGCGALDSPANCSACGVACATDTGTPTCNGTTCSYACQGGHQDCNSGTAPDTDGCECNGTGCCGATCQTAHKSGISSPSSYYDCNSTGNSTQAQAMAACTETGGTGCANKNTSCGGILGFGGTSTSAACGTVGSTCYCWVYSGQNSGQVHSGSSGCSIPCASGSSWD
jgi:hypothetical protein